jgi:hypothetical protein
MELIVRNELFEGITVLEALIQLDERLFPQYLSRLDAVLDPSVDSLVVDVLKGLDIGTVGGLDVIEGVERVQG